MDYCLRLVSIRHKSRMIINKFFTGSCCFKMFDRAPWCADSHASAFRLSVKCGLGVGEPSGHLERILNATKSIPQRTFHILLIFYPSQMKLYQILAVGLRDISAPVTSVLVQGM